MVVLALALSMQFGGQDLLRSIVPRPTGQNGYEEYLKAAQLGRGDLSLILSHRPGDGARLREEKKRLAAMKPEARQKAIDEGEVEEIPERTIQLHERLDQLDLLGVRRVAAEQGAKAWLFVEAGNRKPVFEPRTELKLDTLYPELASFKGLSRLAVARSYVQFADGQSTQGARTLAEGLRFGSRISNSTIISRLVGIAIMAILNAELDRSLGYVSEAGAKELAVALGECLPATPQLSTAVASEHRYVELVAKQLEAEPNLAGILGSDEEDEGGKDWKDKARQLETMGPAQRRQLMVRVLEASRTRIRELQALMLRPEAEWFEGGPEVRSGDGLVDWISESLAPVFGGALEVEARMRTQLRVARASTRVVAYRWRNERLPDRLADAVPPDELHDPLTGGDLQFQALPGGFRVFSKGNQKTGEIALIYKRPNSSGPDLP